MCWKTRMDKKELILYLLPTPVIILVLYWSSFLFEDLLYIGPIEIPYISTFMSLVPGHYLSYVIVGLVATVNYFLFLKRGFLISLLVTLQLMIVSVYVYEVFWSVFYAFTHNWSLYRLIDIQGIWILLILVLTLYITNLQFKIYKINRVFLFFLFLQVFLYFLAIILRLNWDIHAIPYNTPELWVATKVVGYSFWSFLGIHLYSKKEKQKCL